MSYISSSSVSGLRGCGIMSLYMFVYDLCWRRVAFVCLVSTGTELCVLYMSVCSLRGRRVCFFVCLVLRARNYVYGTCLGVISVGAEFFACLVSAGAELHVLYMSVCGLCGCRVCIFVSGSAGVELCVWYMSWCGLCGCSVFVYGLCRHRILCCTCLCVHCGLRVFCVCWYPHVHISLCDSFAVAYAVCLVFVAYAVCLVFVTCAVSGFRERGIMLVYSLQAADCMWLCVFVCFC